MAMTPEQLVQVLTQLRSNEKSFAELTARFDGTRQQHKVEEFITHATIFKDINNISDENALRGLPLLLQNTASTWWDGVKSGIKTWTDACALIRRVFAPPKPDWSIFKELHINPQKENEATDEFISKKRFLLSRLTTQFTETVQIDMIYGQLNLFIREKIPRQDITSFNALLQKSRVVEQNMSESSLQTAAVPGPSKSHSATDRKNSVRCNFCKMRNHTEEECRRKNNAKTLKTALTETSKAAQMSCYGCNAPGVYRSNCKNCQRKDTKTPVNAIEFYSMHSRLGRDIPTVQIKVFGHVGTAHIDTGARTSIASSSLYHHLQNHRCNFQQCVANIMLADGSSSVQTVLTTKVNIVLGDQTKSVQFTILPQATNNRTLLGNDFLETAGIILNLAQQVWSYIQFPMMVFHYETADAMPNAITDFVQPTERKATTKNNGTHTSPQQPLKTVATNTSPQARQTKRDLTVSGISPIHRTQPSKVSRTNSTNNHTFKEPAPPKPIHNIEQKAEKKIGSIFIEYSNENVPAIWTTPPKIRQIREYLRLPEMIPALGDTPPGPMSTCLVSMPHLELVTPPRIVEIRDREAIPALNNTPTAPAESIHSDMLDFEEMNIFSIDIRPDEGLNLTKKQQDELNELLKTHHHVFAETGPPAKFVEHRIDTGDNLPVANTPYRMAPCKRDLLKAELTKMLQEEIIEESESPYAAPVVLIPKKDGGTRVCIDYRQLNKITKPDRYPLPRIDDLLHEAKSTTFMSTMDLRSGYWQIQVRETDREKTAFITPFGMYQFTRMPFGLRNAPATFQRLMDRIKNSIANVPLLAYLDDLIILSRTFDEHLLHLATTFKQLTKINLRAHRDKCRFVCTELKYLGHIITQKGLNVDPGKISAILDLPAPRNIKSLLSFIQTCSWYRRFIPGFADVIQPLTKLTRKNQEWIWKEEQQQAFLQLKQLLTTAPVLRQADENLPFIIRTDASGFAIGAVLVQGEKEEEHPIEYASRLLIPAERNYSTIEREALAVVWAVNKFRGYIDGAEVTVASDHQPLKWLMTLKSPTGRLARWALQLQPYNLQIIYTPGKSNVIADGLSRPPCEHQDIEVCSLCTIHIDIPRKGAAEIREEQLKDEELKDIINTFESTDKNEEFRRWTQRGYIINNGVLYRYTDDSDTDEAQLVIPKEERSKILFEYHDSPTAGHYGIQRTIARICSRYYWPGIRKQIADYVGKCSECQRYKATNQKPAGLYQSGAHRQRFEVISIDLFGPLPASKDGFRQIFIVEDIASRWVELFALKDATAENCADTLINEIFLRYGIPRRIISDNGTQFVSAVMQKVTFCLDIQHILTPVYHPQTNPVERKNRDLKPQLAILVEKDHTDWPDKLAPIRFAMNTAQSQSTGYSAAFLTFGRELRTTDDITHDLREIVISENFIAEISPKLISLADTLKKAKENTENMQTRNHIYTDSKRRTDPGYQPGDRVWVTTHKQSSTAKKFTAKFAPKRDGPYIVLQNHGPASYEIASIDDPSVRIGTYHTSALTRVETDANATIQPVIPLRKRGRPRKK